MNIIKTLLLGSFLIVSACGYPKLNITLDKLNLDGNDWGEKGWELVSTHYFRNKDGDYAFWDEFEVQCIFKRFLISRKEHEEFSEEIAEARKLEEKDS